MINTSYIHQAGRGRGVTPSSPLVSRRGLASASPYIPFGAFDDRFRNNDLQIPIWKNVKFGKGGKDGNGFSTYNKITLFDIGVKQHTNSTNLTTADDVPKNTESKNANFWQFIAGFGQAGVSKEDFRIGFNLDEKLANDVLSELLIKGDIMQISGLNFVAVSR